jgi:legumain
LKNGYKAENIITFAKDDVAHDPYNPIPGKIFNKPSLKNGVDVYAGCVLDYVGADVTPEKFLAVLRGDSAAV